MENSEYPIKETTRLTYVGDASYYIRIPKKLVETGKFPYKNMQPLIIEIVSKDRIVITPLK
jgi:hypothetical protein